jgi:hypothetical protein
MSFGAVAIIFNMRLDYYPTSFIVLDFSEVEARAEKEKQSHPHSSTLIEKNRLDTVFDG